MSTVFLPAISIILDNPMWFLLFSFFFAFCSYAFLFTLVYIFTKITNKPFKTYFFTVSLMNFLYSTVNFYMTILPLFLTLSMFGNMN
jgi:hypothetical protein